MLHAQGRKCCGGGHVQRRIDLYGKKIFPMEKWGGGACMAPGWYAHGTYIVQLVYTNYYSIPVPKINQIKLANIFLLYNS